MKIIFFKNSDGKILFGIPSFKQCCEFYGDNVKNVVYEFNIPTLVTEDQVEEIFNDSKIINANKYDGIKSFGWGNVKENECPRIEIITNDYEIAKNSLLAYINSL